jgi:CRP/FNR family transcriptional regulator, cyclic AMP receptor protein
VAGHVADNLYVVKSGKVEIGSGNRLLETVDAHGTFGEMALINSATCSAAAVAVSDATVVLAGAKQFLFMVSRTPHFALNVIRALGRRSRLMNSTV